MNSENFTQASICNRFSDIYTGAITDSMDEMGYEDQTLDPAIEPLKQGMSLAGVAFPIEGCPNRTVNPETNIRKILQMLGDVPEDAVLMYNTNDYTSAHIGELTTTSLQANGCRGAVIDGGARDTQFILEQDFPVFRRYDTPADCVYRWEILDWGVETVVGNVEVTTGDIIVGDNDGVIVVPEEIAMEVLTAAEERTTSEDKVRDAVREGEKPIDAYAQYEAF